MITAQDSAKPIWQREQHFPAKPDASPYGYLKENTAHTCPTLEHLRHALKSENLQKVRHVWVPERPNFILIEEEPSLLDILKPSRISRANSLFREAQQKLLIGSIILAAISFNDILRLGWDILKSPTMGFILVLFLMFVFVPFYEAWKRKKSSRNLTSENLREEANEIRFDLWTEKQPFVFTKGMLAVIVGIAVLQAISPIFGPIQRGFDQTVLNAGLAKSLILSGHEGWRIWTAPFLHGNAIHIFMNASGLWYIGRRVEVLTKWPHLLFCYLISILVGSHFSLYLMPSGSSVGASGGLMGLLGFLLVFEILHPRLVPKPAKRRLIAGIVLTGIIGLAGYKFIDNAAHAGGLLAGMAYGYLGFKKSDTVRRPELTSMDLIIGYLSLLILASAAIFTVIKML